MKCNKISKAGSLKSATNSDVADTDGDDFLVHEILQGSEDCGFLIWEKSISRKIGTSSIINDHVSTHSDVNYKNLREISC